MHCTLLPGHPHSPSPDLLAVCCAGADPNSVSGERWTPLSTICQRLDSGRLPAALALVEGGADCLLPFPGSNACILELMDRASMRCVLQRVYEQQRWPGARCSARLGQRSTAVPALDLQQLERVATIASRKGSPKPACYFMLRAREQVQHQEQQQQAPPQPPQQQNAAALHRALLHGAARNDDERVLPALMEAGIGEGLTPNDLTLALHAAVRRLRRRIAAVLLTHGAGVLLATLCSAVCTTLEAAGRSFRGGRHRRLLQRGLDVLRLLLAHGRPQVPLGSPTHPVSIACCPFYAMIARLHRGGRMAGHWPSGGEFDQTWGWNRRVRPGTRHAHALARCSPPLSAPVLPAPATRPHSPLLLCPPAPPPQLNSAPPELLRMAETLAAAGYRPAVFQHCTVPGDDEVLQDCCPFDDKADHGGHITQ